MYLNNIHLKSPRRLRGGGVLYLNLVSWFEVRKPNIYGLLLGCRLTQPTKTLNRTVLTSILNSSQLNCEKKEII